jgi:peptide subunit release factor 1 (eRF1)
MGANTIRDGRLRRLAELRPERGLVLSVFFNLDPREFADPAARATEVNSVVTAAARQVEQLDGVDQDELLALRADVERVRDVLQDPGVATNGTRGLAVFACGPAGLLEVVRLPHPIESRAVVDDHPVVEPLVRFGSSERWSVLLVNRRTARIFTGTAEGLEEVDRIEDEVHRQHDQGGLSQARFQRGIEKEKLDHVAHALDALFARFKRQPFEHLVVGAPDELVSEVEERLHPYLRERLAGRLGVDVENSSATDVRAAADEVVERHIAAVEREALDRMHQGIGRGDRGVSGPKPVTEALRQARVEILLLAEDFDAPELDEALELAIRQSAQVIVVRHHDDLAMHRGIGAVLRF